MSMVFKEQLLKDLLSILYKYKKLYNCIEDITEFGATVKFIDNNKLEVMLFSSGLKLSLYDYRQSIFIAIKRKKLQHSILVTENITYERKYIQYLFRYMERYLHGNKFEDTRPILFDYTKLLVTKDVYDIIIDEPHILIL